jgi:hypothetical protein
MQVVYTLVIGFVAASMISVVYRFEPNRMLAGALVAIVFLTGAFAILAKLGQAETSQPFQTPLVAPDADGPSD